MELVDSVYKLLAVSHRGSEPLERSHFDKSEVVKAWTGFGSEALNLGHERPPRYQPFREVLRLALFNQIGLKAGVQISKNIVRKTEVNEL